MTRFNGLLNINKNLHKIRLIDCLKSLSRCKNSYMNTSFLKHLIVLISRPDVFQIPILNIWTSYRDKHVHNILLDLGFITDISMNSNVTDNYVKSALTPLGKSFINKIPNLKLVSRFAFDRYYFHERINNYICLALMTVVILIGLIAIPLNIFVPLDRTSVSKLLMSGTMIPFYLCIIGWIIFSICSIRRIHKTNNMDIDPPNLESMHTYLHLFMVDDYLNYLLATRLKPVSESLILDFIWNRLDYYNNRLLQNPWSKQNFIKMIDRQMFADLLN